MAGTVVSPNTDFKRRDTDEKAPVQFHGNHMQHIAYLEIYRRVSLKNLILSLVITAVLGGIALFWIVGGKLWKQYAPPMPALPDANSRIPTKTGLLIIFGIIFSAGVTVWLLNNIFILIGGVLEQ